MDIIPSKTSTQIVLSGSHIGFQKSNVTTESHSKDLKNDPTNDPNKAKKRLWTHIAAL